MTSGSGCSVSRTDDVGQRPPTNFVPDKCPDHLFDFITDHLACRHQLRHTTERAGTHSTNVAHCECGEVFVWHRRDQDHLDHWLRVVADFAYHNGKEGPRG